MIKKTCPACDFIYLDEDHAIDVCPACGERWDSPDTKGQEESNQEREQAVSLPTPPAVSKARSASTPWLLGTILLLLGMMIWQAYDKSRFERAVAKLEKQRDDAGREVIDSQNRVGTIAEDAANAISERDRLQKELAQTTRELQTVRAKLSKAESELLFFRRRNKTSFVRNWLLIGPFEFTEEIDDSLRSRLLEDLTGSHESIRGKTSWKMFESDEDRVNLDRALSYREKGLCYGVCWAFTDEAKEISLSIGSDDGICVWLNGEEVHRNLTNRSGSPNQDRADVTLRAKWNEVVVRVDNRGSGDWCLFLEFQTRKDHNPLPLLTSLEPPEEP